MKKKIFLRFWYQWIPYFYLYLSKYKFICKTCFKHKKIKHQTFAKHGMCSGWLVAKLAILWSNAKPAILHKIIIANS